MSFRTDQYLALVTSEHSQRPKFMASILASIQGLADLQDNCSNLSSLFDIDTAVGDQLDKLGQWVGVSRNVAVPIANVYFSWGVANQGWGQGAWFSPFDSVAGLVRLPDESYRTLIRATIARNVWDGTVPSIYKIWGLVFALAQFQLLVQDNQDMSMTIIMLTTGSIDAITLALITGGAIVPRPAGVRITGYTQAMAPIFGWGSNSNLVAGWGVGSWI